VIVSGVQKSPENFLARGKGKRSLSVKRDGHKHAKKGFPISGKKGASGGREGLGFS